MKLESNGRFLFRASALQSFQIAQLMDFGNFDYYVKLTQLSLVCRFDGVRLFVGISLLVKCVFQKWSLELVNSFRHFVIDFCDLIWSLNRDGHCFSSGGHYQWFRKIIVYQKNNTWENPGLQFSLAETRESTVMQNNFASFWAFASFYRHCSHTVHCTGWF